jgi:hypothetical protein
MMGEGRLTSSSSSRQQTHGVLCTNEVTATQTFPCAIQHMWATAKNTIYTVMQHSEQPSFNFGIKMQLHSMDLMPGEFAHFEHDHTTQPH